MTPRAVYDTMVFFQWAALPQDRQHATIRAIYEGTIRLCLSQALLDEMRDVLSRTEVRKRVPSLTPERLKQVLAATLDQSEWVSEVPEVFNWKQHPDDKHAFNLAIAARADYLVTWENRIHTFAQSSSDDAEQMRILAPQLEIVTPKELAKRLRRTI